MISFWKFLRHIRWSWLMGVGVFVLSFFVHIVELSGINLCNKIRKEIYRPFVNLKPNPFANDDFAKHVRVAYGESTRLSDKIWALHYLNTYYPKKYGEFKKLSLVTVHVMLSDEAGLTEIMGWEDKDGIREQITGEDLKGFISWAWAFWKLFSVICVLFVWVEQSYDMNFLPHRRWWFWVFMVLSFPWSILIGIALAFSLVSYLGSKLSFVIKDSAKEEKYEDLCRRLKKDLDKTKQEWLESFPTQYVQAKMSELEDVVVRKRGNLVELGKEMEGLEREYSTAKAALELLRKESLHSKTEAELEVWRKDWEKEFDRITTNPDVTAVKMANTKYGMALVIYTVAFNTVWGMLGPMKVVMPVIHPDGKLFEAGLAEEFAGAGTGARIACVGDFCFGNQYKLIAGLVRDWKMSEALVVMTNAFKAGGAQ